jgi:hypothetical protein
VEFHAWSWILSLLTSLGRRGDPIDIKDQGKTKEMPIFFFSSSVFFFFFSIYSIGGGGKGRKEKRNADLKSS